MEEAPCSECDGYYAHDKDCKEDPVKRQPRWGLTVPRDICQTCFAENGHRVTCPVRASAQCNLCRMNITSAHTERMCLIRQATLRIREKKETKLPCDICTGVLTHHWPCTDQSVDVGKGD